MDIRRIDELYEKLHAGAVLYDAVDWRDDSNDAPGADQYFDLCNEADTIIGEKHSMIVASFRPDTTRAELLGMLYESGIMVVEHG